VEWNWQGKTKILAEKPVPVPRCPPQIPHELTRNQTRASAVGGRRLTASEHICYSIFPPANSHCFVKLAFTRPAVWDCLGVNRYWNPQLGLM
jgi:hypothetical protein